MRGAREGAIATALLSRRYPRTVTSCFAGMVHFPSRDREWTVCGLAAPERAPLYGRWMARTLGTDSWYRAKSADAWTGPWLTSVPPRSRPFTRAPEQSLRSPWGQLCARVTECGTTPASKI